MNATRWMLGVVGGLLLFGLGVFTGAMWFERMHEEVIARMDAAAPDSSAAELRETNARLQKEIAELRAAATAQASVSRSAAMQAAQLSQAPQAVSSLWSTLAELQKQKLASPNVTFLDRSGKLNDAFVRLFDLTPAEHETLQRVIDDVHAQLDRLERANAAVTRGAAGEFIISVKPFAEAGGAVYDQFLRNFAQTLGPERHAAFLTLGAEQVERALGRFGAAQRTVTVSVDGGTPQRPFKIRDEQLVSGGRNSSSSQVRSREELEERIGPIAKLLPPDL